MASLCSDSGVAFRQEDMLLKIWGREDSLSVQKVMWCIRELDIPYEQINLGKGYGRLDAALVPEDEPHGDDPDHR